MFGRLIIAALVIASAAFVWWQKGQSETVQLAAQIDDTKAAEAHVRAEAAEQKVKEAEQRAAQAEAKAAFYEEKMEAEKRAADAALEEQLQLHIVDVKWLGIGKDVTGPNGAPDGKKDAHLAVVVEGPATDIQAIRAFSSNGSGDPDEGGVSYTTGGSDGEPNEDGLLAVRTGGAGPWSQTRAATFATTADGKTTFDLAMSIGDDDAAAAAFQNGSVLTVVVDKANGKESKRTLTLFK